MSAASASAIHPRAVLADAIPGARVRDAVLVVAGAVLTAALAQVAIPIPPSPVPVTGQTLAVGIVGATLGMNRGLASMLLYVLAGLALPVYSDGGSGLTHLTGATGGYIIGFLFATALIGYLAERGADRKVVTAFLAFVVGQMIIFAFGLVWLQAATGMDWSTTIAQGFTPFIIGGLIKAAIGGAALPGLWSAARRFEGDR